MIGMEIAANLRLHGLTDVQALLKGTVPRVNEINARLPSQTPTVVYHSTNINMVEALTGLFLEDRQLPVRIRSQHAAIYQHVKVSGKELRVQGEHVMKDASGLRLKEGFLGADEAITNLGSSVDGTNRVATLIVKAPDSASASKKMRIAVGNIMKEYHLDRYVDPSPSRGFDY
jgi:pyrrolysine biosynthesis protein PylC